MEGSPQDHSLITIAALIAQDRSLPLHDYINQAIESGVKPRDISETITHLAFYASRANFALTPVRFGYTLR